MRDYTVPMPGDLAREKRRAKIREEALKQKEKLEQTPEFQTDYQRQIAELDAEIRELDEQEYLRTRTYISTTEYGHVDDHHELISFSTGKPIGSPKPRIKLLSREEIEARQRAERFEELCFGDSGDQYPPNIEGLTYG